MSFTYAATILIVLSITLLILLPISFGLGFWIGQRSRIKKHDFVPPSNLLPPIFARLYDIVDSARIEAVRDKWTETQLQQRLKNEMIQDAQGTWWMMGYRSGKWYFFDGNKWVQKQPPLITD